ncbi:MAG: tetratricopeptide repeat protein [Anaerolineae bacterium]|nr:tetratricopeptide repeat protein [Anaerolineae bacterium]
MNILDQLKQFFGIRTVQIIPPRPEMTALREAVDAGQRAKRAEDYPRALEALGRAMQLAVTSGDTTAIAVIALNQAEVYMGQARWEDARELLENTYQAAQTARQRTQMAYMLNTLGALAQAQGEWDDAQKYYEDALDMARTTRATGAEGRAMGFLADTYLHNANASYAIHLLRDALPKLNMTGDIELSSYFVGQLGEALIASGQVMEGQQMLDRALRLAKQMGYRKYERLWGMALGERLLAEGRIADAQKYYQEALSLFDTTRPNTAYIAALCQMSKVCLSLRDNDGALQYATQAVEHSDGLDESAQAEVNGAIGVVLVARKAYAEAIPHLEKADEAYSRLKLEKTAFSETDIVRNLAAAYAENGDPDAAVRIYQQAAKRAEASGIKLEVAQAHRDLGLHLLRRRKMAEAIREWTTALNIYEAERQTQQVARLYCDIAAARRFLGQGARALKDYEQALMLLSSLNEDWETRGLVLANAATAYVDQGDIDSADSFFNETIAIARRVGDEAAEATRRGNYGWFLLMTGRPQQALSTLEYALRMSENLGLELQAAIQTDNLGLTHDALNAYPRALELHQEAQKRVALLDQPHWESAFRVNEANTQLALGEVDKAIGLYEKVLEQARIDTDAEVIIRALIGRARASIQQGQPTEATPWLNEATMLARKADMRLLLAESLSAASEQQAALQERERAITSWEEARKLFTMLHAPQGKNQPAWLSAESV